MVELAGLVAIGLSWGFNKGGLVIQLLWRGFYVLKKIDQ